MRSIIIIGASGHGKVCSEIAMLCGYNRIYFLDDNERIKYCGEYPVSGPTADFRNFLNSAQDFFVAVGNGKIRRQLQNEIEAAGGNMATLMHPGAVLSSSARVEQGSVLMGGTVVNAGAYIGRGTIINTASSVDHDCRIGDFVHIAVGARLAGTVKIGDDTWVGAGATVSNNVDICGGCMVGSGAVVVKNIDEPGVYAGVPARRIKQI